MKNILSVSVDAKTSKGEKLGFLTGILYFAPATVSGYQVCPFADKAGCLNACLYTAGRGAFTSIQKARIAKTKRFFEEREAFMADLIFSIESLARKANKLGLTPLVRLNGTSDIQWENIIAKNDKTIFELFPQIKFYDYSKIPSRKNIPENYDLTFSYSGIGSFKGAVAKARMNKAFSRIAVVFDKVENIPPTFLQRDVVGGDNSDVRHLDKVGSVVALYAKGKAKKDLTGFVVKL